MDATKHRLSLFSQRLDRAAFTAYLIGAVVPLAALVLLVGDHLSEADAALVVVLTVLSLVSFLALRRATHAALARMDQDNARLAALLDASAALTGAHDATSAAESVARHALALAPGGVAFVLGRSRDGGVPSLLSRAGARADDVHASHRVALTVLALDAMSSGAVASHVPGDVRPGLGPWTANATLALPISGERGAFAALVVVSASPAMRFAAAQADALSTLAGIASGALANADLRHAQRNFFAHVVELLQSALDVHLDHHQGHGHRVAELANKVGHAMGLPDERMQRLHFAALLHDVGMLKLDRSLLRAPEVRARHPLIGAQVLAGIRLWEDCAPIVRHHHEWFDGAGYPDRLAGEAIPLESRIIATCDAFDSMTSRTSYQDVVALEDALAELRRYAGTQFDPRVVEILHQLVDEGAIEPVEAERLTLVS